jgi:lipopolysaccharide biosynthesis glycosyltransferase
MKIAILTCSTQNRKWIYDLTNPTKEKYCAKNNIDYIFSDTFYPDKSRHPYWNKIKMICDYLPKYDWVIWIDDDAGFINNYSFDELLSNVNKPFLYCEDLNGFNSGVMFIKNTKQMQSIFEFIWNKMYEEYKNHICPEQDAINQIIKDLNLGQCIDGHLYNAYDIRTLKSDKNQRNNNTLILHIANGSGYKEMHKDLIKELFS